MTQITTKVHFIWIKLIAISSLHTKSNGCLNKAYSLSPSLAGSPSLGIHLPSVDCFFLLLSPSSAPGSSVQFSSVTQSCPNLCDPMDCSTPGLLQLYLNKTEEGEKRPYLSGKKKKEWTINITKKSNRFSTYGQKHSFSEVHFQKYNSKICFHLLVEQMLLHSDIKLWSTATPDSMPSIPSPPSTAPLWGTFHMCLNSCRKPAHLLQFLCYYLYKTLTQYNRTGIHL